MLNSKFNQLDDMAKDALWFRHDSNASRDMKIMKLRAVYGWEGYGVFFGIIEVLREQDNYEYNCGDNNITILSKILDFDENRLKNIISDCVKFGLFEMNENMLSSNSLKNRMVKWESTKNNPSKPNKNENETKLKPNKNENETKSDDREIERDIEYYMSVFDDFRKLYGGTKNGNPTEFKNFQKKHKDWKEVLPQLPAIIKKQIEHRRRLTLKNEFVPHWKNLSTWINQRCWEQEIPLVANVAADGRVNPNGNGYAVDPQAYIFGTPPKGTPIKK